MNDTTVLHMASQALLLIAELAGSGSRGEPGRGIGWCRCSRR